MNKGPLCYVCTSISGKYNQLKQEPIASLKADISGSKIFLKWNWINNTVPLFVHNIFVLYRVHGEKRDRFIRELDSSSKTEYIITNIILEAKYEICLKVIMATNWPGIREPNHICTFSSNKWELSAFFGSTAGALLALILIILLILFSKRAKKRQKALKADSSDKPKRQRFDSAFESQFDSVAIREDTSFYDEYIISDISFYDSSIKSSSDVNISPSISAPTVIVGDISSLKGIKKRASLIEEESTGEQSHDGIPEPIVFRDGDVTYPNHYETSGKENKTFNLPKDNSSKFKIDKSIMELENCGE